MTMNSSAGEWRPPSSVWALAGTVGAEIACGHGVLATFADVCGTWTRQSGRWARKCDSTLISEHLHMTNCYRCRYTLSAIFLTSNIRSYRHNARICITKSVHASIIIIVFRIRGQTAQMHLQVSGVKKCS